MTVVAVFGWETYIANFSTAGAGRSLTTSYINWKEILLCENQKWIGVGTASIGLLQNCLFYLSVG